MYAWVLETQAPIEKRPLKLVEVPTPEPIGDEIRVKVEYCGICRTDLHIAEGDIPLHKRHLILGHEIVGIVDKVAESAKRFKQGDRVGISWLNSTCGKCKYCKSGRENYCVDIMRTGWDRDGGFAQYTKIREDFAFDLSQMDLDPPDIAPLMCPGIAGYFAFKLSEAKRGDKLGLFGFGPTANYILKVANHLGIEVFVSTRSKNHQEIAKREGALWVGNVMEEEIPVKLDSIILFPPAGELVEVALKNLTRAGILVLAPVAMSKIEIENYSKNLWGRTIKSLYQVRRDYGKEFLKIANEAQLTIDKRIFEFTELQDAMILLRKGEIKEMNAVLKVARD